jgi:hypothetical protein
MSAKESDEWEGEEYEDEEDFVPGAFEDDDDDEGDDDCYYDDDDEDVEDFPSILQGEMIVDKTKGLCYEKDGAFSLVCKTSTSTGTSNPETPIIGTPLEFGGWIKNPSRWFEFEVTFSKEPLSTDPLELKLLEAQEELQSSRGLSTTKETEENNDRDACFEEKKGPGKTSLKTESSHSLEISAESRSRKDFSPDSKNDSSAKTRDDSHKNATKITEEDDTIVVVSGFQTAGENIDKHTITFRGAYRSSSQSLGGGIHLICSTQVIERGTASATASGAAMSTTSTAATAASKKRNRRTRDDDDDESVEGNSFVAYQELIDLHDDSRLSTEELRKKYYMGRDTNGEERKMHIFDRNGSKRTRDGVGVIAMYRNLLSIIVG